MNPTREDLEYFGRFLFLDEVRREPSGKRQRNLPQGFWLRPAYYIRFRESDFPERVFVYIETLKLVRGISVSKGAVIVATLSAGQRSDQHIQVIRNAYYEIRNRGGTRMPPSMWFIHFLSWRDWVVSSEDFTLGFALSKYREKFSCARARRLEQLMQDIRRDPVQIAHNTQWRESQRPGCLVFVPDPPGWSRVQGNHS